MSADQNDTPLKADDGVITSHLKYGLPISEHDRIDERHVEVTHQRDLASNDPLRLGQTLRALGDKIEKL